MIFSCPNPIRALPLAMLAASALAACVPSDEDGADDTLAGDNVVETELSVAEESDIAPQVAEAREVLAARIDELGSDFGGTIGIATADISSGWTTGFNEDARLPQQSVSKLWVALAALDRHDRGGLDLAEPVTLTRDDLTLFHQPIRKQILRNGRVTMTPAQLLEHALTKSDNTANNKLLEVVGGPDAVRAVLSRKDLSFIRFGPGERKMQSDIAGLTWNPSYSFENAFFDARDEVPENRRRIAFEAYLANPVDGASASGMVHALTRLATGDLLKPDSTALLIDTLTRTSSGPRRLKGGIAPGWRIAHKTGTGQFFDGQQSGYNDVALLYSPEGRAYAIAVLIGRTRRPTPERMDLMQQVTRAVIAFDEASHAEAEEPAANGKADNAT